MGWECIGDCYLIINKKVLAHLGVNIGLMVLIAMPVCVCVLVS